MKAAAALSVDSSNDSHRYHVACRRANKFAKRSEQLIPAQGRLLDDLLDTDFATIDAELNALSPPVALAEPRE